MHIALTTLLLGALSSASGATVTDPIPPYSTEFTIINGQIHTPGHIIVNSPQPWTPMGGDTKNQIHEIALFLTSRHTGLNLTISNPRQWLTDDTSPRPSSSSASEADLGIPGALTNITTDIKGEASPGYNQNIILYQEPGSTVKHINFRWPKCFSDANAEGGAYKYRDYQPVGAYNISIHQYSTIDNEYKFSVFNLPIIVKDDIPKDEAERFDCFDLQTGYGGRKGDDTKLLSTWYSTEQLENMNYTDYPWVGEKAEERTTVQFSSAKVDEYVKWPREENDQEAEKRVGRDSSYVHDNGVSEEGSGATQATSTAAGCRQTATVLLGAAAAGLALVI